MDVEGYIQSLTLQTESFGERTWRVTTLGEGDAAESAAAPRAMVDAGALISFVSDLDEQERDDVLHSVQLAQRAATGAFDRFKDTEGWYGKFIEVLERLGWVGEQLGFVKHQQASGELKIDAHALTILAAFATQHALGVLSQALGALQKLSDESGAIILFRRHATMALSGNFQLGAVERAGGTLSMAMGAFHFRSSEKSAKFPFVDWSGKSVEFWSSAQRMTLNPDQYKQARAAVRNRLGDPLDYIAELRLPR